MHSFGKRMHPLTCWHVFPDSHVMCCSCLLFLHWSRRSVHIKCIRCHLYLGCHCLPLGQSGLQQHIKTTSYPQGVHALKTCCLLPTVKLFTLYRLVPWCDILPAQLCANNAWRSARRLQRNLLEASEHHVRVQSHIHHVSRIEERRRLTCRSD